MANRGPQRMASGALLVASVAAAAVVKGVSGPVVDAPPPVAALLPYLPWVCGLAALVGAWQLILGAAVWLGLVRVDEVVEEPPAARRGAD